MTNSIEIGAIIEKRYEVLSFLGKGGSSSVYLGRQLNLDSAVAIKIVDSSKLGKLDAANEAFVLRDTRHRLLPRVLDIFEKDGLTYIVREYCEGEDLRHRVETGGPLDFQTLSKIALQLEDVFTYLHSQNPPLVYRDLKPSNIIIDKEDNIKLIDFGITRRFSDTKNEDTQYIGSQKYAAPEQFGLSQSSPKTDVYSFGLLLYYLYTGEDFVDSCDEDKWQKLRSERELNLKTEIEKAINYNIENRQESFKEVVNKAFKFNDHTAKDKETLMLDTSEIQPMRLVKSRRHFGFLGFKHAVGTSHLIMGSALYLKSLGYSVLIYDLSATGGFSLLDAFSNDDDFEKTAKRKDFKYKKIQVYTAHSDYKLPDILSLDYDYTLIDFGSSGQHVGDFLRMQNKAFILPASSFAYAHNSVDIKEILKYRDIKLLVNLSNSSSCAVLNWMGIPKNRQIHFGFIDLSKFKDPDPAFSELFGIEDDAVNTKKTFIRRLLG